MERRVLHIMSDEVPVTLEGRRIYIDCCLREIEKMELELKRMKKLLNIAQEKEGAQNAKQVFV